ncbi:MAG: hypothetical protein KDI47_17810 [Gammaproteobacteria bacterium]|nr:hypothetical protein [Gammaproteobacteria bacterium]MCB1905499.1 hypothetical protein [Gammaproteobacteria bacterium]
MKNKIGICLFTLLILFMTGCSKVVVKSDSDPNVDMTKLKSFYVQKLAADGRGIEKKIAAKLEEFGFKATSGVQATPTEPVDAIVTYKDRWMWDITMYMLEIVLQLRDPETEFIFATGTSYRTSLARESPENMIDEVLRDMFAGKIDLPEKAKTK